MENNDITPNTPDTIQGNKVSHRSSLTPEEEKEQKIRIAAESASRRTTLLAVFDAIREMFHSHLYDVKFTDKKVVRNMKKSCDKFFWLYDKERNQDNPYIEQTVDRLLAHAEDFGFDDSCVGRKKIFTVFVCVLDDLILAYTPMVVGQDREILRQMKMLTSTPARHFYKECKEDIDEQLTDLAGHIDYVRETTEKILLGEDEVSELSEGSKD